MSENNFRLDMTVAEAMQVTPRAAGVLASFNIGGCAHCHMATIETLEQVCSGYGVDPDTLIGALEATLTMGNDS